MLEMYNSLEIKENTHFIYYEDSTDCYGPNSLSKGAWFYHHNKRLIHSCLKDFILDTLVSYLVKNPKVLFCDEPTGALDEKTGKKVLSLLQDINKKYNTTMIIVTHNPSIALMANTVIKMNSGKIVEVIHNKEIIDAKELRWA